MKKLNKKGQFSIIAALLVAVVLVTALITTYTLVRNSPFEKPPEVLGAVDEMNLAIKRSLEFTVGYYGSVLQVTGNMTYAKDLAANYLYSGLLYVAQTHPEWSPSFAFNYSDTSTSWFNPTSRSIGNLSMTYSLSGLGISNIHYSTSCELNVAIISTEANQTRISVTKEDNMPLLTLTQSSFNFYSYNYVASAWTTVNPNSILAFSNGTYIMNIPSGVDSTAYMVKVVDPRGVTTTASRVSYYTYTLTWNKSLYSSLNNDVIVVEALQNGSLRWLGQNLKLTGQGRPIPPIPVKAFRINQTINGLNRQVPFQVEDWGSDYRVALGLSSNMSVFSNKNMLVFLLTQNQMQNVTNFKIWWDGRDSAVQTSYATTNRYFTNDDQANGVLTNGLLTLLVNRGIEHLYVNTYDGTYANWLINGSSPYLNDNPQGYIYGSSGSEGWFGFSDAYDSTGSITSVKIEFECKSDGDDYFSFRINDGSNTYGPYNINGLSANYAWESYDVSNRLNSWTEINNARIYVTYVRQGAVSSNVYIRRVRLTVETGLSGFIITSTLGTSTLKAEFLRINDAKPNYGASPAYVIHHGIVRDIVQQEAEWGGGVSGSPNLYSQIIVMLPANATYYTYAARTIFVSSSQARTLSDLSAIQVTSYVASSMWGSGTGTTLAENGTSGGLPITQAISSATTLFYNFTSTQTGWMHHWSEFIKNNNGGGIMLTNASNAKLYALDFIPTSAKRGALSVSDSTQGEYKRTIIEVNPVERFSSSFQTPLDVAWIGAVVNFDGTTPIYRSSDQMGLWIIVENPPAISIS
jgi:hypothetical protein